jgi:hypothetical protein
MPFKQSQRVVERRPPSESVGGVDLHQVKHEIDHGHDHVHDHGHQFLVQPANVAGNAAVIAEENRFSRDDDM